MNFRDSEPVVKMGQITSNMYRLGWNERNGGNISLLLDEEDVAGCADTGHVVRTIPTGFDAGRLAGKYFLVTG
ncbi:MAG: class II aldolase/adducin family protein, partial [Firmicutes bacterium]|nr:class II aldolase/adducin family protein [Bacillota bacterium]